MPVTDFPQQGDDLAVSLRNSQYEVFDAQYADRLKADWPDIWAAGGNIEGDAQFARLRPIVARGGSPETDGEDEAIRKREAWAARHFENFRLAGVVAQIKWLVVGSRGEQYMKDVIDEEKARLEAQAQAADLPERKALLAGVAKAPEGLADGVTRFIASTNTEDRDGDTIDQAGWELENYRKNPVFLWAHDNRRMPIGKGEAQVVGDQLVLDVTWDMADPFAAEVKRKYDEGFLSAVSVGFRPIEGVRRGGDARGYHFMRQELLEVSAVPVPSNPRALQQRSAPAWEGVKAEYDALAKGWLDARGYTVTRTADALPPPPAAPESDSASALTPDQVSDEVREQIAAIASQIGYQLVPIEHEAQDEDQQEAAADDPAPTPDAAQAHDAPADTDDPVVLLLID